MTGRRIRAFSDPTELLSGEYGFWNRGGHWVAITPNGHVANLAAHSITEHEDGTITVAPSIAVSTSVHGKPAQVYHGYLKHGVWSNA